MKYQKPTVGQRLMKTKWYHFVLRQPILPSPLKQNNGARLNTPLFFRYCSNRFL